MTIKVFTVEEMVAAEKAADASGVSYDQMMETAGRCVAEAIMARLPVKGHQVLILVGPGNNGGDGLVAGRYLAQAGALVTFYLYKTRDPEEDKNFALIQKMGLLPVEAREDASFKELIKLVTSCDILVDAVLGTGVTRPIGGNLAAVFENIQKGLANRASKETGGRRLTSISQVDPGIQKADRPFRAAVDCPSGLNCDNGAIDPLAITADLTVTFAGPKRGHFIFPGAAACGELVVADIDISTHLPEVSAVPLELATAKLARDLLPNRMAAGHKGTFGTALVAAGSEHYWGAPMLAAEGAYRAGAGLVALAVPEVIRSTIAGKIPEATYPPVAAEKVLDKAAAKLISSMKKSMKGILVGPGLGPAQEFMQRLIKEMTQTDTGAGQPACPLVIDADGLNILAGWEDWQEKLPANTILTPHPGEMARLMGVDLADIRDADRVELARNHAQTWKQILVLKGAYTVVAAPDGRTSLIPFANPLLAVGGSGDVLAGVIVGLAAQGLEPYDAAVLGAYMHGAAGELAVKEYGDAGMLSGELASWIPQVRMALLAED